MTYEQVTEDNRPYEPRGAALEMMLYKGEEGALAGPAGTGKTRMLLEKAHLCLEKYPGMRALLIRKERASLTETALVTYEEKVLPLGHAVLTGVKRSHRQSYDYPNGSTMVLGGLDNPVKVMSSEYDLILAPEATQLSVNDLESLTTRLRNGVMPYQQLLADCNPTYPQHWLKRRGDSGLTHMLNSKHEDNPALYDPKTDTWTPFGQQYLSRLERLTGARYKRLRLGLWVAEEGLVYDTFDSEADVCKPFNIPEEWPRYAGLDFGPINTAILLYAECPKCKKYYLYQEYKAGSRTAKEHLEVLLRNHPAPIRRAVGGAWSEDNYRKEYTQAGLRVERPPIKEVELGIERVIGLHNEHRIKVFNTCIQYLEEKHSYAWKKDSNNQPTDQIEAKNTFHVLDAERYIIGALEQPSINNNIPQARVVRKAR